MPKPLGCDHCRGTGPEPGWIEQDNNGPIVSCPVCNPYAKRERNIEEEMMDCYQYGKRG